MIRVMAPPKITEGTVPISFAKTPDSKAPSSLDELTKIPFTDATRPLISSGVKKRKMVWRITTLTLSKAPVQKSATIDKAKFVEQANTRVAKPKPPTANNKFRHAFFNGGK